MKIFKHLKAKSNVHSFKTQLILFFTVFSLCVIGIGSYITYNNITNIIKEQNQNYLELLFRQSEYNIKNIMDDTDRVIRLFIPDDNVMQFIDTNSFKQSFEDTEVLKGVLNEISDFIENYSYINSIYIYTENHNVIGKNYKYSNIIRNSEEGLEFLDSGIYKDARASYPKTVWEAGHDERNYTPKPAEKDLKESLFTAVRVVTSTFDSNKRSVLVFNIKESKIAELYAEISKKNGGDIYMIDKSGRIISSSNKENIGKESPVISYIRGQDGAFKDEGSYTSGSIQTVYYKLRDTDTDWYLVGEIPLQLFSGDFSVLQRVFIFVFLATILVILTVTFFWLGKITEPLKVLAAKMHDMSSGKLGLTFPKIPRNELGIVIKRFNEMSLSIVELIKKNEEFQEEKRRLEIEALQYQINPHFFYNTLNMIKWMAMMTKSKNIVESIVSLGNLIRPAFKSTDKMCTLNEEKDYIINYLKIMNLRFGNGISLEFHVPEALETCRVPRFILQPVVENSITHGIKRPENTIDICVEAFVEANDLYVVVADNGIGIGEEKVKEINTYLSGEKNEKYGSENGSIGLYNVHRRIALNFGPEYGLSLERREGGGTKVRIKLPANNTMQ